MEIPTGRVFRRRIARGGFSLVEIMVAASVLATSLAAVVVVNSHVTRVLRRGANASFASQLIQERMEQFRRAAWTDITCPYPPAEEGEVNDDEADGDPWQPEPYPTVFPYDIENPEPIPGMVALLGVPAGSASQLNAPVETVTVEAYNSTSSNLTLMDWDGSAVVVPPFSTGCRPIRVKRENGVVTELSRNAMLPLCTTVRLTINVTWRGLGNKLRTKETVTLFTVEGDK